jgi:ABC-2 type transport system permease protein
MMGDFKALLLLLDLKLADLLGALRSLKPARLLGMVLSVVIAVGIAALVYRFDLFVFDYLMGIPELGKLVIARFFELAFLLFFLVLMISTALTALSMLYREDELSLLLSLPISSGAIFTTKYFEVIVYSSWALVALTVPFILSYGVYFGVDWPVYFTLFAGLMLPLVLISGSIGVAAALLLRWLLGGVSRRRLFSWGAGILALVILVVLVLTFAHQRVGERGIAYLFSLLEAGETQNSSLFPHKLISQGFLSVLEGRWDMLQRVVLTLLGLSALILLLTLDMGKVLYYRSWLAGSDRAPTRGRSSALFKISFWRRAHWISPLYRALFRKDLLEFRRYPLQWGQAFLLLGFWALYLVNIFNIRHFFDVDQPFWKMLLYYANFCFSSYFAAALAGRFVFPIVSLEGQTFWILKAAPLAMDSFLWSKFWQAFIPLFFLTGTMVAAGNLVLDVHMGLFQVSLLCIFIVTFSLTALALGLGAHFADFSQRNPMKIANTPGGILCIFISLVFMVLMTTIFGWPTYLHYKSTGFLAIFPLSEWITAVILFIAFGVLATLIPLKIGLKALNADLKI